jgi:hypothetical protein
VVCILDCNALVCAYFQNVTHCNGCPLPDATLRVVPCTMQAESRAGEMFTVTVSKWAPAVGSPPGQWLVQYNSEQVCQPSTSYRIRLHCYNCIGQVFAINLTDM